MKTPTSFKSKKSGKRFVVTKSPRSVFTARREAEIKARCFELLRNPPPEPSPPKLIPLPSLERLNELFFCNTLTGVITRKINKPRAKAGTVAGTNIHGYLQTYVDFVPYRNHRLVWKFHYKRDPIGILDHIDGNRSNNSISNLREATALENARNRHATKSNTGVIGVSWSDHSKRFHADIGYGDRSIHLGQYVKFECAIKARKCAERILFKLDEIRRVA